MTTVKWSPKEDQSIKNMLDRGETPWQIALKMRKSSTRSKRAIDTRARGLRDAEKKIRN